MRAESKTSHPPPRLWRFHLVSSLKSRGLAVYEYYLVPDFTFVLFKTRKVTSSESATPPTKKVQGSGGSDTSQSGHRRKQNAKPRVLISPEKHPMSCFFFKKAVSPTQLVQDVALSTVSYMPCLHWVYFHPKKRLVIGQAGPDSKPTHECLIFDWHSAISDHGV